MTLDEFKNLKVSFPWRYEINRGNITVFDKNNNVVNLLTLIELVIFLSQYLEKKDGG